MVSNMASVSSRLPKEIFAEENGRPHFFSFSFMQEVSNSAVCVQDGTRIRWISEAGNPTALKDVKNEN